MAATPTAPHSGQSGKGTRPKLSPLAANVGHSLRSKRTAKIEQFPAAEIQFLRWKLDSEKTAQVDECCPSYNLPDLVLCRS